MPARTILVLGGTHEAAALAERLNAAGDRVVTSLAGRTADPAKTAGSVRIGGFGGAEGLARYLVEDSVDLLVDATHPFATRIAANAQTAAAVSGKPRLKLLRPAWTPQPGDRWQSVPSTEAAAEALTPGASAFLALGSQHLDAFAARPDCRFLVRMVDPPATPLPIAAHRLVLGRPSRDPAAEEDLLRRHEVSHVVCRNSGGTGASAKLDAARHLGLAVVMIERPPPPAGPVFTSLDDLIAAIG